MSNVCRQLRRIMKPNNLSLRHATAPQPKDNLFKEPNVDLLASSFKRQSTSFKFRANQYLYSYTINRLAQHKRFSSIEDIIESHKKYNVIRNERFAARLIRLYGSAGMFKHAHNLFDELPELKCRRTNLSFNALLVASVYSNEFEQACEIFCNYPSKLGVKLDVVSYNCVIKALGELNLVDVAISMVDEMMDKGLKPDLITFHSVLDAAYEKKGFLEGEKVWKIMLGKIKGLVPDIRSYNAKLNGMVNEGMVLEAVDLVEEFRIKELKPTLFTYNCLIKGFCKKGDVEEAKNWYRKLVDSDLVPNWATFDILVKALCGNGDTDLAFDLSQRVLGRALIVDEGLLQMVVDSLVKDSKVEDAEKLVELGKTNYYYQYNLVMPST